MEMFLDPRTLSVEAVSPALQFSFQSTHATSHSNARLGFASSRPEANIVLESPGGITEWGYDDIDEMRI